MDRSPTHIDIIQEFLAQVVKDDAKHQDIVVHEAVEALGNMNKKHTIGLLKKY